MKTMIGWRNLVWLLCAVAVLPLACTSAMRQARRHLRRGDIAAAAEAAGDDRYALQEVALEVLARGLADPETREGAIRGFRSAGELARPRLRSLANDDDDAISSVAAAALIEIGDRRRSAELDSRLDHADPFVRATAVRGLGPREDDPEFFRLHLNDADSRVRGAAVDTLVFHRDDAWAADLLAETARRDPEAMIRAAALRALSRIEHGEVLLEAARDELARPENPISVRLAAVHALGQVDDIQSAEVLLLDRLSNGEPNIQVRAAAVLASYGNEMGHEYLRRALTDRSVSIAEGAALAAGSVGGPLQDALVGALERPEPEVRFYVASSLLSLGERRLALDVLDRLSERPDRVGLQAAIALASAEDDTSRAAVRLAAALDDDSPAIRAFAARSCGSLDAGWELASAALGDEVADVRIAAASSVLRSLRYF